MSYQNAIEMLKYISIAKKRGKRPWDQSDQAEASVKVLVCQHLPLSSTSLHEVHNELRYIGVVLHSCDQLKIN